MSDHYDLIVIGAGSAARDAAGKAVREHGARVAMIERERWGGSCPNVACSPTKAYLVAADLIHDVNELAATIGIDVGEARANLARIYARKEALKKTQAKWLAELQAQGFDTIKGEAAFVDPHTLRVGDRKLAADRILVATGSRTAVPPIEGIADVDWLDHVSALELTELPESLLVVGAGAVGLEFGQAFSRFGSRVTIVDALDQIAPRADAAAAAELQAALESEGIPVILGTFVQRVVRDGDGVVATLAAREGGATRELRVERILLASGRMPNLEELGLDGVGVRDGAPRHRRRRPSAHERPGIWAAGDVTGLAPFTPIAQYQARIAVDDMFGSGAREGRLLDDSGGDLHRSRACERRAHRGGRGRAGPRRGGRLAPAYGLKRASYIDAKHGLFKIVYDRGTRTRAGPPRRVPQRERHRAGARRRDQPRCDGGRPGPDAHHTFPTFGEGVKAAAEKAPS